MKEHNEQQAKEISERAVEPPVEQCVVDMFSREYDTTVRSCLDCGVLIVGGATRCGFCAFRYGARQEGFWDQGWRLLGRLSRVMRRFKIWKDDS